MAQSAQSLSTEQAIHGGYLHLAIPDLSRRLSAEVPSLYDCLLAAIYFRKCGDQRQALQALDLHRGSAVFETTYNQLQSLGHTLDFAAVHRVARSALEQQASDWSGEQQAYLADVIRTSGCLGGLIDYPTALQPELLQLNGYRNLDSGEPTPCSGLVDSNRRTARLVDACFDPISQCWIEHGSGAVVAELLQPNHDLRAFYGGAAPWAVAPEPPVPAEELSGTAVYIDANPHYGHFLTQSASFAASLPYAEHLVSEAEPTLTVLSKGDIPGWAQELLQTSCRRPLQFRVLPAHQALRAQRLVVSAPTWIEWHYVHRDHQRVFRQAAMGYGASESGGSRLLYFSRSRLEFCLRRSENEQELEAELLQRGFEVVHPQELPLAEVARLVNEAALIAGAMGSAMHNVLFRLPGPPLHTLNFAHYLPGTNNALIERCSGVEHNSYLRCTEETDGAPGEASSLHFDRQRCLEGVSLALDQLASRS